MQKAFAEERGPKSKLCLLEAKVEALQLGAHLIIGTEGRSGTCRRTLSALYGTATTSRLQCPMMQHTISLRACRPCSPRAVWPCTRTLGTQCRYYLDPITLQRCTVHRVRIDTAPSLPCASGSAREGYHAHDQLPLQPPILLYQQSAC